MTIFLQEQFSRIYLKHLAAFLIYLLTAKLHGYGLGIDIVNFLSTYLKEQKPKVSVNNISSIFELILLGVPQGSMLDQISFSISHNGLSLRLKKLSWNNFAYHIIFAITCNHLGKLCQRLNIEPELPMDWFKSNKMIFNSDKFQAIILREDTPDVTKKLRICNNEIENLKSQKLLGIQIDYEIKFDEHIFISCSKPVSNWTFWT